MDIPPVERCAPATHPLSPKKHRLAWVALYGLLAAIVALYAFAYRPLQDELARAERTNARELREHTTEVETLKAELERTRAELARANAAAEAARTPAPVSVVPSEQPNAREARATKQRARSERAAARRARAKTRAAAAAATAALERRAYGHSKQAQPKVTSDAAPALRKPTADKHPLADVLMDTDDPLAGL